MSIKATQAIKQAINTMARQGIQVGSLIQGDARITRVQLVDCNCFNVWVDTGGTGKRCFEVSIKERF